MKNGHTRSNTPESYPILVRLKKTKTVKVKTLLEKEKQRLLNLDGHKYTKFDKFIDYKQIRKVEV